MAWRPGSPPSPWLQRNQWLLYAALAVAVAILVLIAVRALHRPVPEEAAKRPPTHR